jgi:hypothetical protein
LSEADKFNRGGRSPWAGGTKLARGKAIQSPWSGALAASPDNDGMAVESLATLWRSPLWTRPETISEPPLNQGWLQSFTRPAKIWAGIGGLLERRFLDRLLFFQIQAHIRGLLEML